ncbi:CheW domain-containing protein [Waterburya agarophytonicola K14]|uniref:CheW domain-containing protein n=1 Tax=Waterburya agarophytonicola KI4 TaxID=2874699 RepID=A0A964BPD1_9CYAN|nr:chemotaxis protein CheW [Waterburya agarophytonicola]MCC0176361.1 CheW domain-containing protein [Waterburya agarophytonicola KI4]
MNQEYFSVALSPEESLAIPLPNMGKVVQIETIDICAVPGIADFWYGVVNFKGSLLWVLDSDRYFNLNNKKEPLLKKLTAVIIKQSYSENSRKIALVTPQLSGIISLKSEQLKPLPDNFELALKDCCSAYINLETKRTFILNPINLLQKLHQQSSLASA